MNAGVQRTVLERAAEICGGPSQLRLRLGVEEDSLRLWLTGDAQAPEDILLLALDLALRDDLERSSQERRLVPRLDDPDPPTNAEYQSF